MYPVFALWPFYQSLGSMWWKLNDSNGDLFKMFDREVLNVLCTQNETTTAEAVEFR